ncbi:BICD family-like cargo adapter 1 [Mercenaria mercenaria]|uniref:BICD family-like cargo adapter 1 n=1 Tax=Mercenaria mercenaria TaxID=6596 RepID=UPI00234F1224|nr:BICD family-like cargo adapter 1 [Mercenaria mercenaria]
MDSEREVYAEGEVEAGDRSNYGEEDNLRAMLEQKDRDLMLAAELGKALLEKNLDQEKKLEQVTEEYNQNIEALEQERHGLHLKLENLEGEYENTVKELQYDIAQLREELDRNKHDSYAGEKNKLNRIQELSQQNEKLLEELQNARRMEQEYESKLHTIKNSGLANISAKQACQIEHLQEQSDMANLLGVQMEAGLNPALKLGGHADVGLKPSANLKENDSSKEMKKENEEQPEESVT